MMLRTTRRPFIVLLLSLVAGLLHAQAGPDHPAAIVVFPYIVVNPEGFTDTTIQLSNTSELPLEVRCFYQDLTPDCENGQLGESCTAVPKTCSGQCINRAQRIPFRIRLTPRQPIAWSVSAGADALPIDGIERLGIDGSNNQFSRVPALGNDEFVGMLHCISVSSDPFRPAESNSLVGVATIQRSGDLEEPSGNATQYRAIGFAALTGAIGNDQFLQLGGDSAEYDACPDFTAVDILFHGAQFIAGDTTVSVAPSIVLVPCSLGSSGPPETTTQFLVYNEYGQRFSTSLRIRSQFVGPLTTVDTSQPTRSIFFAGVSGTLAGRTIIHGQESGLHILGLESQLGAHGPHTEAFNTLSLSNRQKGDVLAYRAAECRGDCDLNGAVAIEEIVSGVNIALGNVDVARCDAVDRNRDDQVTVDELVTSAMSALEGCPDSVPSPTPTPEPDTPIDPPAGIEPEVTHFGLATADDVPLEADASDSEGRPIFVRPFGQGITLIIEARTGTNNNASLKETTYSPGELPGLQLLVSRPLGDGDPAVCESDGRSNGIPATVPLTFKNDAATIDAINDLGCRAFDREPRERSACTRKNSLSSAFSRIEEASHVQFCVPIARAWAFPVGDTIVAARVADSAGNVSEVKEIVVRVLGIR